MVKVVETVAIIGGGPVGSGIANAFIQEGCFKQVKVFEKRANSGGVWNYSKSSEFKSTDYYLSVPSLDPYNTEKNGARLENGVWPSAMYKQLDTNIPKCLMNYNHHQFLSDLLLFPLRSDVLSYVKDYAAAVAAIVAFDTQVTRVSYVGGKLEPKSLADIDWDDYHWEVEYQSKGECHKEQFDAVVVASGHFETPYLPDFDGLKQWNQKFPGTITHAKSYNDPSEYKALGSVLVVGNSASALEVCNQISGYTKVYKSIRSFPPKDYVSQPNIEVVPQIKKFDYSSGQIELVDGTKLENIGVVIFATGYLKAYPYLKHLSLPYLGDAEIQPLISPDGFKVNGLFNHLISYQYPGLAFGSVPKNVVPFRLSESQGSWLLKVWSNKIKLPDLEEMKEWERLRLKAVNFDNYIFHSLPFPQDVAYYNVLNEDIARVGGGLKPAIWDEEQVGYRGFLKAKSLYLKYGKGKFKSIEELEPYKDC